MSLASFPILNSWSLVLNPPTDPYKAPEQGTVHLHGVVSDHPWFEDGASITTTELRHKELVEGELVAITYSGTRYRLGTVDPAYESLYPDARDRVFGNLTDVGLT